MTAISCHEFGYRRGRVLRLRFPRDWQLNWIHSSTFGALWPKKIFARRPSICADISCFFFVISFMNSQQFSSLRDEFFFPVSKCQISFSSHDFLFFFQLLIVPPRSTSIRRLTYSLSTELFFFLAVKRKFSILRSTFDPIFNFEHSHADLLACRFHTVFCSRGAAASFVVSSTRWFRSDFSSLHWKLGFIY